MSSSTFDFAQALQLRTELRRLRVHFLPQRWDPTGSYTQRQLDRTRAYRILAHAEIEFYIENILLDTVERNYQQWVNNKLPNYVMICIMAASKTGWQDVETADLNIITLDLSQVKIKRSDDSIHQMIDRSVDQYREIVRNNNGIKDRDIKRLIMPIGIALSDLDQTWLNNMNSFGGQRGFVAHTSRMGLTTPLDPRTEQTTVANLLAGLKDLDEKITQLP